MLPPPPDAGASGPVGTDPLAEGLPKRFGKYTLLRKLATGGMAELFLALQKSVAGFEKLIVIKRILPQMNSDGAFIEMLLAEARIAATLSHPNIVQIFDVGQVDGTYYIAMEHVHGEDIRSIVRAMKVHNMAEFPREHALGIILGVCAGLAYAHERKDLDGSPLNIVHRDVSPQNVVVTFSGDVKVVDFGIAKSDGKMNSETRSGKLKGKVPYMSPEQARGEKLDARSDVFAAGVMLFELTTGRRLFKGQSEYETLKLICDREYPTPSSIRPDYPPELEKIVMKALAKERDERYQSAREMQGALEEFIRGERIAVSNIALQQFMQTLFEEKLATQKEALLQGKQLAEIIELTHSDPPPHDAESSGSQQGASATLSMPAASRTVTDVAIRRSRSRAAAMWALGGAAAALLLAVGVGTAVYVSKRNKKPVVAVNPPPVAPVPKGAIDVSTTPPGAAIWIDGDLRPEVTPAKITDLPTGRPLEVKLTMEGFEVEKQSLTLDDGKTATLAVPMKTGSVTLEVALKPNAPGAVLLVDGKKAPALTLGAVTVSGLASGDQHKVVVDAPGYAEQSFAFIGAPQETKHLDVTLVKEAHHHTGGAVSPPQPSGSGKLNVATSSGWCNVSIDGAAKGATPVAGIELPAGPHKVTCTTAEGKVQSATVNVPADGTARYRFNL